MKSYIRAISYHLPDKVITNNDLAREFPDRLVERLGEASLAEAQAFLQAYSDRVEDDSGLALLPLFLSLRAAVRARSVAPLISCPAMAIRPASGVSSRPAM